MTAFFNNVRVVRAVLCAVFGLFAVGCEKDFSDYSTNTGTSSTDPVMTVQESVDTTNAVEPVMTVPRSTDTTSAVLNDDPNCELLLKYQGHNITNSGQVHYVNRVLTSDPFGSANPICVQYNDTQTGEVTVWKNPSSTGQRIDILPSDRGIDKIVVWYK